MGRERRGPGADRARAISDVATAGAAAPAHAVAVRSARARRTGRPSSQRGRIQLIGGVAVLLLVLLVPVVAPEAPSGAGLQLSAPSAEHLFGTDRFGRDVFDRFLAGGQMVTVMSIAAGAIAAVGGALIGMLAGYRRGPIDAALMRSVDVLLAMPPLLLILVFVAALPRSNAFVVVLVGVLLMPGAARIMRGITQQIAAREYIASAEAAGERAASILVREILPNVRARLVLEWALRTSFAVLVLASLNFLGVGVSPTSSDWGVAINEGKEVITVAPWVCLAPALGIVMLVMAINVIADGLGELWR